MSALAKRVRAALEAAADPARAPGMQAYMKSAMPYLGVSAVPLRAACKQVFAGLEFASSEEWQAAVLAIWRGAKSETDLALLEAAIAPSLGSKEFFLRKAIGWALRQYARTDPAWVAAYVAAHDAELSPLRKREALKHIPAA